MNIMVLDDDVAFLRSMEILLTGDGHHVTTFSDPNRAGAFLADSDLGREAPVGVLLLDYVLLDRTGADFLREVKGLLRGCDVILISGYDDQIDAESLDAEKVKAILPKPLEFDRLRAILKAENGDWY